MGRGGRPAAAKENGLKLGSLSPTHRPFYGVALMLALMIVSGWLRFQNLGRDSLWVDESISAWQARLPLRELLQAVASDVHPPLYHLLLHGILTFGDSETILRWPSALFGTLSIPLIYLFGRALFTSSVGLLAALLLAVSPLHLWHSQDARMYTLLTFEGLLSWSLFASLLRGQRPSLWVGYFIASEAILYTHYYGALLLLAQAGVVGLLRRRGEVGRSLWLRLLIVQAGVALLFIPWAAYALPSIQFEALRWFERAAHPLRRVPQFLVGLTAGEGSYAWVRGLPAFALALVSLVRGQSRCWRTPRSALCERSVLFCVAYFAVPIAIMLAISLVRPLLVQRHMLMTAPAFFLLVAVGLTRLLSKRLVIAGAAALVLLAFPGVLDRLSGPRTPDYRGVASFIGAHATANDLVLFHPSYNRMPFKYYVTRLGLSLRWCPQSLPDSSWEIMECLRDVHRVWVVFSEPWSLERKPDFLAPLGARFRPTRVDHRFLLRVARFDRTE